MDKTSHALSCSPCPFCGNVDLGIGRGTEDREGYPTYVYCGSCGAQGPWIYTRGDKGACTALACEETGWNKRTNSVFDGDGGLIMAPHQERVVHEKKELDEKVAKLDAFVRTDFYKTLPADEQGRLKWQQYVMEEYSRILGDRIAAFPAE